MKKGLNISDCDQTEFYLISKHKENYKTQSCWAHWEINFWHVQLNLIWISLTVYTD